MVKDERGYMKSVGDNISAEKANWTFGGDVANSFDDHVSKSVPLYKEGHILVSGLSDFFIKNDSFYDITVFNLIINFIK